MRPCRWLALVAPLLVLAGCSRPKPGAADEDSAKEVPPPVASVTPTATAPPAPPAPAVEGPTRAECEALAARLEAAARDGNADELRRLIDRETMLGRAVADLQLSAAAREKLLADAGSLPDLAAPIKAAVSGGGSYRLVRLKQGEDGWRLLFRLTVLDGRVDYHELTPARGAAGTPRVVGAHVYLAGEPFSAALRRGLLPMLAKGDVPLSPHDRDWLGCAPALAAVRSALRAGDAGKALEAIRSLPRSVRSDKDVVLARLRVATMLGGDEARRALDDCAARFPGEPCVDLARLEALMSQGKPAEVLAVVDRLERAVGGDPYLDTIRANAHLESGDLKQARQAAERVCGALPDLATTYLLRLAISLYEKDHAETARWLTVLRERAGVAVGEIESNEAYADFVRSPEYRRWASRKK
jgi:hypothetical protein